MMITAPGFSAYPALSILAARFQENRASAEKLVSRVFLSEISLKTIYIPTFQLKVPKLKTFGLADILVGFKISVRGLVYLVQIFMGFPSDTILLTGLSQYFSFCFPLFWLTTMTEMRLGHALLAAPHTTHHY